MLLYIFRRINDAVVGSAALLISQRDDVFGTSQPLSGFRRRGSASMYTCILVMIVVSDVSN